MVYNIINSSSFFELCIILYMEEVVVMKDRVVINPGRPKGSVIGKCSCCGYEAYIPGSQFKRSQNGGRFSSAFVWTDCGNADCEAKICVSVSCIPDDVEIPN